jgi:hypothetical protein
MTPAQIAAAARPDFDRELSAHLLTGYVFSSPEAFIMGRAVDGSAAGCLQADPFHVFPAESCDTWLVWLAAGDLARMAEWVPYRLPWIAWARRDGPLRRFRFDRVLSSCT